MEEENIAYRLGKIKGEIIKIKSKINCIENIIIEIMDNLS